MESMLDCRGRATTTRLSIEAYFGRNHEMAKSPAESVLVYERSYLPTAGGNASTIAALLRSIWAFYRNERFVGLSEVDGDMLLFQSGTYDWGDGPFFEIDLTRQFVEQAEDGEETHSQFHLTCRFKPDEKLEKLGKDSRWCDDPSQIEEFASWVENHAVVHAVAGLERTETEISWEPT